MHLTVKLGLDPMEIDILKSISERFPFTLYEVKELYIRCKSFDKTIKILEMSSRRGFNPVWLYEFTKK